jgi:hypothetical protein
LWTVMACIAWLAIVAIRGWIKVLRNA